MSQWIKISHDLLNSYECQSLPPAEFWEKFMAAVNGAQNVFSKYVQPCTGRLPAKEWSTLRRAVFLRDKFTCQYCGESGGRLECDHVKPLSRGGSNNEDNLVTACRPCNRSKHAKTPEEWLGSHPNH